MNPTTATWSKQTRAWVRGKNGISHLEPPAGTADPPVFAATAAGATLSEAWNEKDNVIASRLLQSLDSTQRQHITNEDASSATIWRALQAVHQKTGFSTFFMLQSTLQSTKYVDGQSMQAHLHVHVELRKRITAAGLWLPDMFYCGVLLHSLP